MKRTLICAAFIAVAFAGPARAEPADDIWASAKALLYVYDNGTEKTQDNIRLLLSGMNLANGLANNDT